MLYYFAFSPLQAVEILKPDYRPSDVDILYAEHVTSSNGLSCVEFSFPETEYDGDADSGDLNDSLLRYCSQQISAPEASEKIFIFFLSLNFHVAFLSLWLFWNCLSERIIVSFWTI